MISHLCSVFLSTVLQRENCESGNWNLSTQTTAVVDVCRNTSK